MQLGQANELFLLEYMSINSSCNVTFIYLG